MSAARINVLVTGYGNIGTPILKALTQSEFSNRIRAFCLVRPASLSDPKKKSAIDQVRALGVALLPGDLEDGVPALTALLKDAEIQTVVAVVGGLQIVLQLPLVEAAKAAGVRHYIPSEFGWDSEQVPVDGAWAPYLHPKLDVEKAVQAAGLDYTLIFTGMFTEFLVPLPIAGIDLQAGKVAAPGSWETKLNTTSFEETSWHVAAAVVEPQARNARVYCGETVSYKQLADLLDAARGKPVQRSIRTVEDAQAAIAKNPDDFPARLVPTLAAGKGVWWPASKNYLAKHHPERKQQTVQAWIAANVKPAGQ